jgi:TRAP-type C4-dicarboxylate transport system permease small subunit
MLSRIERIIAVINRGGYGIAQMTVVVLMVLVGANILLRKVWHPIIGTYDYVGFITAVMAAFSIAYCASVKGHVAVDMLVQKFPQKVQTVLDVFSYLMSLAVYAVVTWRVGVFAEEVRTTGSVSLSVAAPYHPYLWGMALGLGLLCLVLLGQLIRSIASLFGAKLPAEPAGTAKAVNL